MAVTDTSRSVDEAFSQASLLRAYEKMSLIRIAEEKIADHYLKNKIMSFVHFYIGQEAVAVGVAESLTKNDKMLGNHRSHGHYLAKGGDLKRMICELLGKKEGLGRGKSGSMHMMDRSAGFAGSTPILGSVVPLACGVAFAQKYRKETNITAVFYGDGASEEGVVYETMNLAGLFRLPLLMVIENNLYSVNSPIQDRRAAGYDIGKIVEGFGARYVRADGLDYRDVRKKAKAFVDYLREGNGPAVVECITYRHMAHSAPIFDESCRTEDVREKREQKDAIKLLRSELLAEGVTEEKITEIEKKNVQIVEEAILFAVKAPFPDKRTLFDDVYV